METIPFINERWKLYKCACFIGCITLFYILNHNHQASNLLTIPNLGISIALRNASETNLQVLEKSSSLETENQLSTDHEEDKCNIFEGKWIYDPDGSPLYQASQCPFLSKQVSCRSNGRSNFDYEKWSWVAKGCNITRFNGKDMLEKLRGKRVIIVGDSLNRNQWESLACLLYSAIHPSQAYVDVRSGFYKVFKAKEYNCSVEFYWSPFLVQLDVNKTSGDRILKLDKLSASAKKWRGADIMVFNTGHWWDHRGKLQAWDFFQKKGKLVEKMEIESALGTAMGSWSRWIDRNVDGNKTRVFFRSISPEHKGKQWCYNETQPMMDDSYMAIFPEGMIQIVEKTIQGMKTPVTYLNITNLSQYRRDAHPSIYRTKQGKTLIAMKQKRPESLADCSHWCLPGLPDTWNRLLLAILFETSTDISIS